ncbi:MAG: MFS transporter [Candidatus Cryptobacteroides sp.]|jgi:ACS family hexuronate transporter-like MFS transporter
MSTTKKLMTNWRWWMVALLFLATTINYLDRQVLSLTWKDFIAPEFHWNDNHYGTITAIFSLVYAICMLFAGKFIDWMGTKKGFLWSIGIWSTGAVAHAGCGWLTLKLQGYESVAMMAAETGAAAILAISTCSVWLFIVARCILALGEAGNFPAAIKTTAEYFPKKDRAFATSIFNSGASIGALLAPATIPLIAQYFKNKGVGGGWEMAFIIIGSLGYIWMIFWAIMYAKPEESKHVNAEELAYIQQDYAEETAQDAAAAEAQQEKQISLWKCFSFKQTWAFIVGKFFTDGVWWFYLFWAPAYFSDQFGYTSSSGMGIALITTLYAIVTVISIFGGYLPRVFVDKRGMNPYQGRMLAMLIFAFFPIMALFAQPLGVHSAWWPALLIGLAGAGHQAWSANLFSTIGDMFPKGAIATVTGIGGMAGGIGSFFIQKGAGLLFTHTDELGTAFSFLGFSGKQGGYFLMFCFCGIAYLVAWSIMKILVPKYKLITI